MLIICAYASKSLTNGVNPMLYKGVGKMSKKMDEQPVSLWQAIVLLGKFMTALPLSYSIYAVICANKHIMPCLVCRSLKAFPNLQCISLQRTYNQHGEYRSSG